MAPFGSTLLELDVRQRHIGDAALAMAINLVWLDCSDNGEITTVAPFGQSLRHLVACTTSSRNDESLAHSLSDAPGLSTATNLVTLHCSNNPNITSIEFCRNRLQELSADGKNCGMKGDEIAEAPHLWKVYKCYNEKITVKHLKGFTEVGNSAFVR